MPELAELTVLEAMLLSSCGPTYSAICTFYVKDLPNAAEAGELFGCGLLIGHHCVKQFAPADIAAFVKSIDDAGTLQYDSNKAPLPLNVHVVMPHGELRNQAAVLDAIAKCKRVVTCRPAEFATAVRWLKEHNAKCDQLASPVTLAPAHVHAPAPRQPAPSGGTLPAGSKICCGACSGSCSSRMGVYEHHSTHHHTQQTLDSVGLLRVGGCS